MNFEIFTTTIFERMIIVTPWKVVGLLGAMMFASRWFVQAYYSRKAGKPVTPRIFWIMSVIGSLATLSYFMFSPKSDMVGIVQNLFPSVICGYNLYLDLTHEKKRMSEAAAVKAKLELSSEQTVATHA